MYYEIISYKSGVKITAAAHMQYAMHACRLVIGGAYMRQT